jgi:uncharacterized protein (TIGR03437 family)
MRSAFPSARILFMKSFFRNVCCALLVAMAASAATLQVGASRTYKTPCAAIAAAATGDTIEIDAETYVADYCTISRSNLKLVGVGGRPRVDAAGAPSNRKAIWVIAGNNTTIENIEFTGARLTEADGANGAGIRQEGHNLTVRDCYFHDNDDGILTGADSSSEILIEYTEFAHNGFGDGQSHNMYIGHVGKFTLRFCYTHDAAAGHLIKSRAAENYILYNRITGENGTDSYELDFPDGGKTFVIGNLIQQGPKTENPSILAYFEEARQPNPDNRLFVVNNTFVNGRPNGATFLAISAAAPQAVVKNNIFVGPGTLTTQSSMIQANNLITNDAKLADLSKFDYHLRLDSPAFDAGADPGNADSYSLAPDSQYVHPACGEGRKTYNGKIDIGAYELGSSLMNPNASNRCRKIRESDGVVNSASLTPGPVSPGSIITVFGSSLSPDIEGASTVPLPVEMQGTALLINGKKAPLYYVSPTQINAQMPFDPTGDATAVVVNNNPVFSTLPATFQVIPAAPGIFTWDGVRAIAQNPGYVTNGPSAPAAPGTLVTVYMNGQGPVDQVVAANVSAPLALVSAILPKNATVGSLARPIRISRIFK